MRLRNTASKIRITNIPKSPDEGPYREHRLLDNRLRIQRSVRDVQVNWVEGNPLMGGLISEKNVLIPATMWSHLIKDILDTELKSVRAQASADWIRVKFSEAVARERTIAKALDTRARNKRQKRRKHG